MSGHPIDGVQTEFMNEQARLRENILIACREQIHALGVEEKRAMHYKEADALVVILPNDVVVELQNFIEEFAKKLDDYLP